jgi:RecA/RadA recombinase
MDKETRKLTKMLKQGVKVEKKSVSDFLSTGNTLLNLGCSGRPFGGFAKGLYYFIVGDTSSGKTFLSLTCFAEAVRNPRFKDYRLVYDPTSEDGAQMDIAKFFGSKVEEQMELPPRGASETIEDFYDNITDLLKEDIPLIYVLDSENGLTSEASDEKFEDNKRKRDKGTETKGEMGDGKAKKHSENMRRVCRELRRTGSILIVLSQTREKIGFVLGDPKTRSGGRAISFYASLEMWSSVREKIKRRVRGQDRVIGTTSRIHFRKNRFSGFEGAVHVDHYKDTGFDDVGSCIDYLVEEKHWKMSNDGSITAPELRFKGTREGLIAFVEAKNYEKDLSLLVGEVWQQVQDECKIERKKRYE